MIRLTGRAAPLRASVPGDVARAPAGETIPRTELARWRLRRGLTQVQLAQAIGITRATYIKLEQGRMPNPPLRYLSNCAIVLGVPVQELIEPEWQTWMRFDARSPHPPDPSALWRQR